MKLIFIYGPPGVGKLTVAKELSKLTKFKIFHNHLTIDLVKSIFDYGTPEFWKAVHKYRFDLIERAARSKIKGLIFTLVYAARSDDRFIGALVSRVEKHKGKVLFVHLTCNKEELFKRVKHPSRKLFHKVKTHKELKGIVKEYDLFSNVPYRENMVIDNTKISPKKVAKLIQKHYRL